MEPDEPCVPEIAVAVRHKAVAAKETMEKIHEQNAFLVRR
jgi:hypothetical protein